MGYSVDVRGDHIYVKYSGVLDGLDIVRLMSNSDFINDLRHIQQVVHDASDTDSVSIAPDQVREIGVLLSIESNFTENLLGIIIPKDESSFERLRQLKEGVKSKQWTILTAQDYTEALNLLKQAKEQNT